MQTQSIIQEINNPKFKKDKEILKKFIPMKDYNQINLAFKNLSDSHIEYLENFQPIDIAYRKSYLSLLSRALTEKILQEDQQEGSLHEDYTYLINLRQQ